MSLNLSKTFVTFSAGMLLVAASATSSDARQHAQRQALTQSESSYYRSGYDTARDRDSSCFSRATGLSDQYACSSNGG